MVKVEIPPTHMVVAAVVSLGLWSKADRLGGRTVAERSSGTTFMLCLMSLETNQQ